MRPELLVRPASLADLWKALPALPRDRRYLAGGTDLMIAAGHGHAGDCWVDISGLKELKSFRETSSSIFIGSGLTIAELAEKPAVKKWLPALALCAPHYASPSLRNMATIGGNAANGSPCADGVCALVSEKASIVLSLKGVKRKLPLPAFFLGPKRTALKKDELILGFEVPKWRHVSAYEKLGPRSDFGISKVSVCVSAEISGGIVKQAVISCASVAPVPLLARKAADFLYGRRLDEGTINEAAALAQSEASPISDTRSEAGYRKAMVRVLAARALKKIAAA
jgi:carbon-monoxide dehydrogenase medium subunit